jgi:AraC-like DNA-binding protein
MSVFAKGGSGLASDPFCYGFGDLPGRQGKVRVLTELTMSYDLDLLFTHVIARLDLNPCTSLTDISRELQISQRTIQKSLKMVSGKQFRKVRQDLLITKVQVLLTSKPTAAIKELSAGVGYASARSFARAIRSACGLSPRQLRSRIVKELLNGGEKYPILELSLPVRK